jgi:hypothetical protein
MGTILGKRKTRSAPREEDAISTADAQAIFQRHFEASFAPLAVSDFNPVGVDAEREEDEESNDSEWGGLSGEDGEDDESMLSCSGLRCELG